jgi:hypothetical protein
LAKRQFLQIGWQLRQQERVADADFIPIEGFDRGTRSISFNRVATNAGCLPVFAAIWSIE